MMRFDTILQTCSNLFNTNMTKYLHFEKTADKMTYYYKAIPRTAFDKQAVKNIQKVE